MRLVLIGVGHSVRTSALILSEEHGCARKDCRCNLGDGLRHPCVSVGYGFAVNIKLHLTQVCRDYRICSCASLGEGIGCPLERCRGVVNECSPLVDIGKVAAPRTRRVDRLPSHAGKRTCPNGAFRKPLSCVWLRHGIRGQVTSPTRAPNQSHQQRQTTKFHTRTVAGSESAAVHALGVM